MVDVTGAVDLLGEAAIAVGGTAALAAIVGLLVAAGYRSTTTRSTPAGTPTLVGLATVASYLSVVVLDSGRLLAAVPLDHGSSAGYLLATFLGGGLAATAGGRLGDRVACQVAGITPVDAHGDAAAALRSARLAVDVALPEDVDLAEGYRPVDASTRRALAGTTVRLPHGLSLEERRERVERHLERDYGVGYARVTMAGDGGVDRVVVGRRSSGLGSTLPPGTVAVAVRADAAPDASLGDPVELRSAAEGRLVATGRLRTVDGPVATVIVDADRAPDLSAHDRYRLVTRPDEPTDGDAFAAALRAAEETVVATTVEPDGPLVGEFVGWLPGRVLVVDRDDALLALPADGETLEPGDTLWVLASPADLKALDVEPLDSTTDGSSALEPVTNAP